MKLVIFYYVYLQEATILLTPSKMKRFTSYKHILVAIAAAVSLL